MSLASAPAPTGLFGYLFNWPYGQTWPGIISSAEFVLVGVGFTLALVRPLRKYMRRYHEKTQKLVSEEVGGLREFVSGLVDGDAALERHTETLRQHVSDEIEDLRRLMAEVIAAVSGSGPMPEVALAAEAAQQPPEGQEELDLWICPPAREGAVRNSYPGAGEYRVIPCR